MGLQTQAAAATVAKPTAGVAVQNDGGGIFYTVPAGKYFVGYINWSHNNYGCQINGINMFTNSYSNTSNDSSGAYQGATGAPITLYAGMTVGRGSSGSARVVGVEYDL